MHKDDIRAEAERLTLDEGFSWQEAASELNRLYPGERFTYNRVRGIVRKGQRWANGERSKRKPSENKRKQPERREEESAGNGFKSSEKINADGSRESFKLLELYKNHKYTPDELLKLHGFDPPDLWEMIDCKSNVWNGMAGKQRNNELVELWQSTLRARPRKQSLSFEDVKQTFRELATEYSRPPLMYIKREGRMMAEVNIADLHLGKLCWHGDTGNDYDYKIARESWNKIVSTIYGELKGQQIEQIILVVTNDFFNSDNPEKTTTAGTPQDTDIRWQKLYKVGLNMLTDVSGCMMDIAETEALYTASNHDLQTMFHAICHLEGFFRNNKDRFMADTNAMARKYRLYGSTLLGFTHGDTERKQARSALGALAALPPVEARELWGQAKRCEVHAAHLHCEQAIDEVNGVIVRRVSSPTATDTWHYQSGYVGAIRKAQTFIYDRDYGLIHTINTPV